MKHLLSAAVAVSLFSLAACSSSNAAQTPKDTDSVAAEIPSSDTSEEIRAAIIEAVHRTDPTMRIAAMRPAIREGWHEIHYRDEDGLDQFAYASNDGETLIIGEMVDMQAGVSVSLLSALALRDQLLDAEVDERTIEWQAADPTQRLYAFTDPTCEPCKALHAAIPALNANGITVEYLAFPAGENGSDSYAAATSAWCADNRQSGFTAAMEGRAEGNSACDALVEHHKSLGKRLGVESTPMLVSSTGLHLPGFPGESELISLLALPPQETAGER